jgi:hypothetical protein
MLCHRLDSSFEVQPQGHGNVKSYGLITVSTRLYRVTLAVPLQFAIMR